MPEGRGTRRSTGVVDSGGEHVYYEVVGTGAPLVLCHGLGGNHASWWQQVAVLGAEFEVVTWDQRGFGNSTRRTGRFGPEVAVDDLAALLDHLGHDRAHVVGQSMGGWVAMGLALRAPERLLSLTLTDTIAGAWTPEVQAITTASVAGVLAHLDMAALGRHVALGDAFAEADPERAVLYQLISSMGDKPPDVEVFAMLGTMRFSPEQVASLAMPVHLVVGEDDRLCPPEAMRLVASAIPGATFTVLAGTGHSPYFEDAPAWNAAVLGFLRGVASPAGPGPAPQ
ncbi:MAG TPA: alpha/beta fold hydrolase [Acidimicrobiales bacterium]|nr:alpha/beta fold hydrolase [Acidimicrobiales bacterium]